MLICVIRNRPTAFAIKRLTSSKYVVGSHRLFNFVGRLELACNKRIAGTSLFRPREVDEVVGLDDGIGAFSLRKKIKRNVVC